LLCRKGKKVKFLAISWWEEYSEMIGMMEIMLLANLEVIFRLGNVMEYGLASQEWMVEP
jgi:hypothetical protein